MAIKSPEEEAVEDAVNAVKKLGIDQPGVSEQLGNPESSSARYHRELQMIIGDIHLGVMQRVRPAGKKAS